MMRIASAAVGIALLVAGCSGSSPRPPTPSPTVGTLTGRALLSGGPATLNGQPAVNHEPVSGQTIRVHGESRFETTTMSGAGGVFTFRLPPGGYTLECGGGQPFKIKAGQTVTLDCEFAAA
jgi:hypothetical protein